MEIKPMQTISIPACGEAIKAVTVSRWCKKPGEMFQAGELLVELEAEQALVHLTAKSGGKLVAASVKVGQTLPIGAVLGTYDETQTGVSPAPAAPAPTTATASKTTEKAPVASPSRGSRAPVVPLLMPQAGNSMEEGTIVKWRVNEGDTIAVGQVICEIETDKATVEVEATDAGRLGKIVAGPGAVVPVKQPIAYLGNPADVAALLGGSATSANAANALAPVTSKEGPGTAQAAAPAASSRPAAAPAVPSGVIAILMPQAGNSMEEGTIVKWRVQPGDRIAVGQIICDIETDKATVEVEATDAGRLAKITAPEGAVVPVKQPMAYLAEKDADVEAYLAAGGGTHAEAVGSGGGGEAEGARSVSAAPTEAVRAVAVGGRVKASPAARKLAASRGIDLGLVGAGSGPEGRILSTDVANAKPTARPPAGKGQVVRRPLSKMRRAIASNLQTSKQTVPHFYVRLTIHADPLFAYYKAAKPATGCTLNDVILLAVGRAVGEFPAFRSRIEGNELVELPAANIGVAVSVAEGLVVPAVMNVDRLTLAELARKSKRVVEAARNGKIENMGKAVFTISNMGMLGVEDFVAIINPPESGILSISAVRENVIVKDGAIRAGKVMSMTLSVDHRVVDGAMAAQFMARLKETLEAPEKLA